MQKSEFCVLNDRLTLPNTKKTYQNKNFDRFVLLTDCKMSIKAD